MECRDDDHERGMRFEEPRVRLVKEHINMGGEGQKQCPSP